MLSVLLRAGVIALTGYVLSGPLLDPSETPEAKRSNLTQKKYSLEQSRGYETGLAHGGS